MNKLITIIEAIRAWRSDGAASRLWRFAYNRRAFFIILVMSLIVVGTVKVGGVLIEHFQSWQQENAIAARKAAVQAAEQCKKDGGFETVPWFPLSVPCKTDTDQQDGADIFGVLATPLKVVVGFSFFIGVLNFVIRKLEDLK